MTGTNVVNRWRCRRHVLKVVGKAEDGLMPYEIEAQLPEPRDLVDASIAEAYRRGQLTTNPDDFARLILAA